MDGYNDVDEFEGATQITAYRVHGTELQIGELVPPSTMFAPETNDLLTAIEDAFAERCPSGLPERRGAIFVFEATDAAREFALKNSRSRLYRVSVRDADILHRADWTWLDEAKQHIEERARWADIADLYWAGKFSSAPVVELLVRAARVEAEIAISHEERLQFRAKRYGLRTD